VLHRWLRLLSYEAGAVGEAWSKTVMNRPTKTQKNRRRETVSRSKTLEILSVLNSFYSLRRLEVLFGIPYQVLWRYINLLNVPEEKTAEKIVETANRLRLLEKAAEEAYVKFEGDVYRLARHPGFIKLCSLLIESAVKELGVNYVYSASSEAVPLASAAAVKLEAEVCPTTCYVRCERERCSNNTLCFKSA